MAERLNRLDKIGICLSCGVSVNEAFLDSDHMIPKAILRIPSDLSIDAHPFRKVVLNRRNVFRMCRNEHIPLDHGKNRAFLGADSGKADPEALIADIMENYPLTTNIRYFDLQRKFMVETSLNFIDAALHLNGELPRDLVKRYHKAADLAAQFAMILMLKDKPLVH